MAVGAIAKAALEEHMPMLRECVHAQRYGWEVDMDWETGLCHVRLGRTYVSEGVEVRHSYLLRLSFDYYPREQPGVIFVDPASQTIGSRETFLG